jgi:hypothetical protein
MAPQAAGTFSVYQTLVNTLCGNALLQYSIGIAIVVILFRLEASRRSAKAQLKQHDANGKAGGFIASAKKILEQCMPEIVGLIVCLAMAIALRMNEVDGALDETVDVNPIHRNREVLENVKRTWPILLTADSLLGMQAMLRLLVVVSSVVRTDGGPLLLSREVAAISAGAMLGRVNLASQWKVYRLDGPLGGFLPMACDLVSAPFLGILSFGITYQGVAATGIAMLTSAVAGSQSQLTLADDRMADGLFIFVHCAELFAALAYLYRAMTSNVFLSSSGRRGAAFWFAHMVMPIQAALSAYYFVVAFKYVPGMVAAGFPFEILHMGGMLQVAAYTGATVFHFSQHHVPHLSTMPCTDSLLCSGEIILTPQALP